MTPPIFFGGLDKQTRIPLDRSPNLNKILKQIKKSNKDKIPVKINDKTTILVDKNISKEELQRKIDKYQRKSFI